MKLVLVIFLCVLISIQSFAADDRKIAVKDLPGSSCLGNQYSCSGDGLNLASACPSLANSSTRYSGTWDQESCNAIKTILLENNFSLQTHAVLADTSSSSADVRRVAIGIVEAAPADMQTPAVKSSTGEAITNCGPNNQSQCYCPVMPCQINEVYLRFKAGGYVSDGTFAKNLYATSPRDGAATPWTTTPDTYPFLQIVNIGANQCLLLASPIGHLNIGCKIISVPPPPKPPTTGGCLQNSVCVNPEKTQAKAWWSLSGRVVECVTDAIDRLILGRAVNDGCPNSMFKKLQDNLRTAVFLALAVYVALFGIKLATSEEVVKKPELFTMRFKVVFVLYFATGIKGADGIYYSGMDQLYDLATAARSSFSEIMLQSSNSGGLCNYNSASSLSLWDSLDCRLWHYIGSATASATAGPTNSVGLGILKLFVPLLFSAQIIFCIMILLYFFFVLYFVIYFVHYFLISIIALAVMMYLGVLVVPLILFEQTKQYFDAWLRSIISFALQPVLIVGFLGMIFLMFDNAVYGYCKFTQTSIAEIPYWYLSEASKKIDGCSDTLGARLLLNIDNLITYKSALFFDIAWPTAEFFQIYPDLFILLGRTLLFAILMTIFGLKLNDVAADLTGGAGLGKFATAATAALDGAWSAIKFAVTKGKGGGAPEAPGVDASEKSKSGVSAAARK